jgi:hypothetical protein
MRIWAADQVDIDPKELESDAMDVEAEADERSGKRRAEGE